MMLLCRDCKFFKPITLSNDIECHHENNIGQPMPDYVNGGTTNSTPICYSARYLRSMDAGFCCGPDAKWFEPKAE